MFQQVILVGRLTRDVELRTTSSGKSVASASLVTSKKFKKDEQWIEQSEFHNLVIWQGSENFAKYLKKGSKVQVIGELKTDMFEKEGQKHYNTKIIVNQFLFLDSATQDSKHKEVKEERNPFQEEEERSWEEEQEEEIRVENIPF